MLKKCLSFTLLALSFSLVAQAMHNPEPKTNDRPGANNNQNRSAPHSVSYETAEKYEIMHQDEIDDSDTLAIPLDQSSIEDEEELDRLRGEPFTPLNPVPQNRNNGQPNPQAQRQQNPTSQNPRR